MITLKIFNCAVGLISSILFSKQNQLLNEGFNIFSKCNTPNPIIHIYGTIRQIQIVDGQLPQHLSVYILFMTTLKVFWYADTFLSFIGNSFKNQLLDEGSNISSVCNTLTSIICVSGPARHEGPF